MRSINSFIFPLLIVMLNIGISRSQDGSPYITNFKLKNTIDSYNWSLCQDNRGMLLVANRKGVYSFDEHQWELIETPTVPYVVKTSPLGVVFVGCKDNFGYLETDSTGRYSYQSLNHEFDDIGEIVDIHFTTKKTYFYSTKFIIGINNDDYSLTKPWKSTPDKVFAGMVKLGDNVFVNIIDAGLHQIDQDTNEIWGIKNGFVLTDKEIIFSFPYDSTAIYIGTSDGDIFMFNGNRFTNINVEDMEYLSESILINGVNLNDKTFALSTMAGGCLIIDKKTKKTLHTLNFQTGLPDDEIYTLAVDANQGLWVTHQYGLSRIDTRFPVKNYASYPGIPGILNDVIIYHGSVYLASNDGVYFLDEVKAFEEIEVLVKKRVAQKVYPTARSDTKKSTKKTQDKGKQKIFSLKKKKKGKGKEDDSKSIISKIISSEDKGPSVRYRSKYVKEKTYALQSISHTYKKVENLDEKCTQFEVFMGKLVVGTNNGLFEIKGGKVTPLINNVFVSALQVSASQTDEMYVGTMEGLHILRYVEDEWVSNKGHEDITDPIYSILEDDGDIWLGGENVAYRLTLNEERLVADYESYLFESDFPEKVMLKSLDDEINFMLLTGIYMLDGDSIIENITYGTEFINPKFFFSGEDYTWIYDNQLWNTLSTDSATNSLMKYFYFFDDISTVYIDSSRNVWLISSQNMLYMISKDMPLYDMDFNLFVNYIKGKEDQYWSIEDLVLDYKNSSLKIIFAAPLYLKENTTQYQFTIEGLMDGWSVWSGQPYIDLPYLPHGSYTIKLRAQNILGDISEVKTVSFTIEPPFWKEPWFYGMSILIILVLIIFIIIARERKLKRDKRILEEKVRERTAEVVRQKNEIAMQKKEIEDSIIYAKRIQNAILPKPDKTKEMLPDHFILFRPRDIVSGDFYWINNKEDKIVIVAADCTGHGVPGAFMSMLGVSFLNEIVNKKNIKKANDVLNELRDYVISTLAQRGERDEAKDGMDLSLCILDMKKKELQFAGAYNPLYLLRNGELLETSADNMPIAIHERMDPFTNKVVKLTKGDTFYIFSDGYADQFGGEKGKKFLKGKYKKLLASIQEMSMEDQKKMLEKTLDDWKGDYHQVDDILVIGVRV